jgi:hypothetical protein
VLGSVPVGAAGTAGKAAPVTATAEAWAPSDPPSGLQPTPFMAAITNRYAWPGERPGTVAVRPLAPAPAPWVAAAKDVELGRSYRKKLSAMGWLVLAGSKKDEGRRRKDGQARRKEERKEERKEGVCVRACARVRA